MDFEISQEKNEAPSVDSGNNVETVGAASAVAGADTVGSDVIPIGSITSRGKGRRKKASNRNSGGGNGDGEGDHEGEGEKEKKIDPRSIEVAHLIAALLADDKEKVKDHAANLIGSGVLVGDLPEPDVKLAVVVDDEMSRILVNVDKKTGAVNKIVDDAIDAIIGRYLHEGSSKGRLADAFVNGEKLTATKSSFRMEIVRAFHLAAETIPQEDIAFFKQRSDPGLAWFVMPYDFHEHIYTPSPWFDEVISRCGDKDTQTAVMAWFGSLFFKDADRSQYMYWYGEGENTKGRMVKAFIHTLPKLAQPMSEPKSVNDPGDFWAYGNLVGKRLVCHGDLGRSDLVTSAFFKSVTGDDYILVNRKQKSHFSARIFCKFFLASNQLPAIKSNKADMRRAIFIEPAEFKGESLPDAVLEKIWEKEMPGFLARCVETYMANYPNHGRIRIDMTRAMKLAEDNEAVMRDIVANDIVLHPSVGSQAILVGALLKDNGISEGKGNIKTFIRIIEKVHGITIGDTSVGKVNGEPKRAYWGIGVKRGAKGGTLKSFIKDGAKADTIELLKMLEYHNNASPTSEF